MADISAVKKLFSTRLMPRKTPDGPVVQPRFLERVACPAANFGTAGLKGDKAGEMSLSTALTALTKCNQVQRWGSKYYLASSNAGEPELPLGATDSDPLPETGGGTFSG